MMIPVCNSVENIVGKGENAGNQHFLLFPQCFQKISVLGSLKVGIVWCRVKRVFLAKGDILYIGVTAGTYSTKKIMRKHFIVLNRISIPTTGEAYICKKKQELSLNVT